jgi:diguanylate cyclase (GGDEF)-like protein
VSERVRRVVAADPIVVGDISVLATLSAGVAGSGPGCDSPERLIQAADEALYEAKAGGRNRSEMWIPPFAGATA